MEQIKSLIENHGDPDAPLLFAGDFNFNDRSEAYEKMMEYFGANDTWLDTHDSTEPGYTYDAYENRYAHDYSIKTNEPLIKERIDFVLHRPGSAHELRPISSQIVFRTEPLYSDHYGIEAHFELKQKPLAAIPFFSH
jgi:endonuclease/exonuclease/phosphatase family metal-dependent hydrolase